MKKINLTILIVVVTCIFTIVSKACTYYGQSITGCFQLLTLTDGLSTPLVISQSGVAGYPCDFALNAIIGRPYIYFVSNAFSSSEECPPSVEYYCCVEIEEVIGSLPGIPYIDIGNGLKQYKVKAIVCRTDQITPE